MSRAPIQFRDSSRISAELFCLTYGSLVAQLLHDYETDEDVTKQLETMGYNIGVRLIEDFLSHTSSPKCQDFTDAMTVVVKDGFRIYLGVVPSLTNWSADAKECSIMIDQNPLTTWVELPENHPRLFYSTLLCGVVRGCLEMVNYRVEAKFVKDVLCGDEATEMRVKLLEVLHDSAPSDD
eukprot:m.58384 g.58384  ORF g.58384 m.58384 type:complete len:180 (+) comp49147_c0_seq2:98-637(+)